MVDLKTVERQGRAPDRRKLVPALALGAIALVALAMLIGRQSGVASPETVANAHMEARADLEGREGAGLFADDATVAEEGFELDELSDLWAWYQSVGWDWTPRSCEVTSSGERGELLGCGYTFENDLTRVLGHPPVTGEVQELVSDGRIANLVSFLDVEQFGDVWETFVFWIAENHPDDFGAMYVPSGTNPRLDEESRALWERHIEEFAVSHQG